MCRHKGRFISRSKAYRENKTGIGSTTIPNSGAGGQKNKVFDLANLPSRHSIHLVGQRRTDTLDGRMRRFALLGA
jgi:hypothetical protein